MSTNLVFQLARMSNHEYYYLIKSLPDEVKLKFLDSSNRYNGDELISFINRMKNEPIEKLMDYDFDTSWIKSLDFPT